MSAFDEAMDELEAKRCTTCKGVGTLDDAEDGDIFYSTWTCDHCDGSGFKPEKAVAALVAVSSAGGQS